MENEIKPSFYRRKAVVVPAVLLLSMVLVAAAVVFSTSNGSITITEALNQTEASFAVSGFPGEVVERNFSITNDANVPLPILVSWAQDVNLNGVNYTTNMPKQQNLSSGANTVTLRWTIESGSPVGSFNGTTAFTRQ